MEEMTEFLKAHPILSIFIVNLFISAILAIKILYSTTPAYKKAYREADIAQKWQLIYGLYSFKTEHVTEEGAKTRTKLLISGILYVFLLIFL